MVPANTKVIFSKYCVFLIAFNHFTRQRCSETSAQRYNLFFTTTAGPIGCSRKIYSYICVYKIRLGSEIVQVLRRIRAARTIPHSRGTRSVRQGRSHDGKPATGQDDVKTAAAAVVQSIISLSPAGANHTGQDNEIHRRSSLTRENATGRPQRFHRPRPCHRRFVFVNPKSNNLSDRLFNCINPVSVCVNVCRSVVVGRC